jgi:ribA/ribD-fused uncharacterized protein
MNAITSFSREYHFLSNFFTEPDGTHVEGEYQARKTLPISSHIEKMKPGDAKRAGKKVKLRPDWEQVKLRIMDELVMAKFVDHPELREKLLATRDVELIEVNAWGDRFWGMCHDPVTGQMAGKNHLGLTLMGVRDWLR